MDFFVAHGTFFGVFLLLALAMFPRISMICMLIWGTLTGGGVLWWLGAIFLPHVVVAVEATSHYWDTNPVLCVVAWLVAFGGTFGEGNRVNASRSQS
jgi:hypothetical protein